MAAGSTYTPIATTTLSSATASYTFSSIPSTYTDLVLVINGLIIGADAVQINLTINGTADSTRSYTRLQGNGTTASSIRGTGDPGFGVLGNSEGGNIITSIMNYSNTTTYKTILSRYNSLDAADGRAGAFVSLWASTAAINSLTITPNSGLSWASGTVFTLYGITAA